MEAYCFQAYADALEVIPTTLAENAGLNPIAIVTELRNRHALGEKNAGINVRKVCAIQHFNADTDGCVFEGLDLKHS
jgi:chaperonin GroEL (HSP60 family)